MEDISLSIETAIRLSLQVNVLNKSESIIYYRDHTYLAL